MTKSAKAARKSGLFLDPKMNIRPEDVIRPRDGRAGKSATGNDKFAQCETSRKVDPDNSALSGSKRAPRGFVDGIVNGERVHIAQVEPETEKGIELRIRVALASAGVMVMKHHVDNSGQKPCSLCGHRDPAKGARTGLGIGVSDLICVVPPFGRFLGIEVKKPGQKPRDEQRRWLAVIRRHGGVTGVATTVEEAMALVAEARQIRKVDVVMCGRNGCVCPMGHNDFCMRLDGSVIP